MSVVSLAQASTIVDAALKKGRETNCAPLTVAVLDAGGHLVAFKREDKSGLLRFDIAFGKAWGALGMGFGSRTLAARAAKTPQFFTMLAAASGGRMVTNPGGVLIRSATSDIVGAVGISGDTSDRDEACAVAGIEAGGSKPIPGRTRIDFCEAHSAARRAPAQGCQPCASSAACAREPGITSPIRLAAGRQSSTLCGHLPRPTSARAPSARGCWPLALRSIRGTAVPAGSRCVAPAG
jgi:uncharacterized protein GlcG (DUF336 family)